MKKLIKVLIALLNRWPVWAYGLHCDICKASFTNANYHYNYVEEKASWRKHQGKIPVLKK